MVCTRILINASRNTGPFLEKLMAEHLGSQEGIAFRNTSRPGEACPSYEIVSNSESDFVTLMQFFQTLRSEQASRQRYVSAVMLKRDDDQRDPSGCPKGEILFACSKALADPCGPCIDD